MRDANILRYVARTLWSIDDQKWGELLVVLLRHIRGERLSAEALAATLSDTPAPSPSVRGATMVIPIRGVIAHRMNAMEESSGGTSAEHVGAMIKAAAADERVGTILYDVDSPGGTVPGIQELAAQMFALRGVKRQIALANDLMASAAYWLASQADEIVAIPSASVGSIGVFSAHQDISQMLEKEGVKITLISAGRFKTENNPWEPLTDDGRAHIQQRVDEAYALFVKDVARGRGVTVGDVKMGFGEGRLMNAREAKAAGMIDRIATLDETLTRLARNSMSRLRAELDAERLMADTVPALSDDEDEDRARRLRL